MENNRKDQLKKLEEQSAAEPNFFIRAYEKYRKEKAAQTEEFTKKKLFIATQRLKESK
jgi:hypothetical protein